jgi:hypothetical protein
VPADAPVPVADAARTRTAIWITEEAEWRERYPHLADSIGRHGFPATGLVPLVVEGRSVGVIVATFRPRRAVPEAERTAVLALAEQCAQALDRARLHDAEHGARARPRRRPPGCAPWCPGSPRSSGRPTPPPGRRCSSPSGRRTCWATRSPAGSATRTSGRPSSTRATAPRCWRAPGPRSRRAATT